MILRRLAVALLGLTACQTPEPPFSSLRLVDDVPGMHTVRRDGTIRRVLDPARTEHTFFLEGMAAPASLVVWLAASDEAAARFEIHLEHPGEAGEEQRLFDGSIATAGWQPVVVSLGESDLARARLRLRSEGGIWGTPVVRSAAARSRRSSVILVSLDTLRADFVGADGTPDAGTPVLDRLAAGGLWYERAYSPSTWTIPSHIAMLSGVYPEALPLNWQEVLETLPKTLRAAGYLTAAFTGGGFMSPQWGFETGFDTFHAFTGPDDTTTCVPSRFDASEGFTRAATWIREHAGVPFFLFLHTYDIHDDCPFAREGKPMEAAGRAAHYRGLVAEMDARLGHLLDAVTEAGIAATTLIVVTSDHGEGFGEHGFFGHGCRRPPYEELTRVPLVVHGPGVRAARVATPVSVVDVAPTVLTLLDVPVPDGMQGHPLPGLGVPGPAAPPPVFVHCEDWLAAHVGNHKLITSRSGREPDRVFDLDTDPAERTDLSESVPEVRARLQTAAAAYWEAGRALRDARAASGSAPHMNEEDVPPAVDEPTRRRLRDLGYLDQADPHAR